MLSWDILHFISANVSESSGLAYELLSSAFLLIVTGFTHEAPTGIDCETQVWNLPVLFWKLGVRPPILVRTNKITQHKASLEGSLMTDYKSTASAAYTQCELLRGSPGYPIGYTFIYHLKKIMPKGWLWLFQGAMVGHPSCEAMSF